MMPHPRTIKQIIVTLMAGLLVLSVLALIAANYPFKSGDFTRDPAQIMGGSPFFGVLSNLGILIWSIAASVSLFAAALLKRINSRPDLFWFFLFSGLITAFLVLDDLFILHDEVFPRYLNIPRMLVLSAYMIILVAYVGAFLRTMLNTEYFILLISFILLIASVAFDMIPRYARFRGFYFVEDGFKFLGILLWTLYFVSSAYKQLAAIVPGIRPNSGK